MTRIVTAVVVGLWLGSCGMGDGLVRAQDSMKGSRNDRVPVGFHEFEMFGDTSVFLSHYAMFGSIHAYQVLLEAKLTGNGNDPRQLYLDHKKKNPAARYSLSPETPDGQNHYWVMPETIKKGQTFRANIHWDPTKGHPVYISRNVTVEIVRIIYFRLFQPDDKKRDVLSYLLFGNRSEAFLAHDIGAYPDFDQVLAVRVDPAALHLDEQAEAAVVEIPGRANTKLQRLLLKDRAIAGRLNGNGDPLTIGVRSLVHYEPNLEIQK